MADVDSELDKRPNWLRSAGDQHAQDAIKHGLSQRPGTPVSHEDAVAATALGQHAESGVSQPAPSPDTQFRQHALRESVEHQVGVLPDAETTHKLTTGKGIVPISPDSTTTEPAKKTPGRIRRALNFFLTGRS